MKQIQKNRKTILYGRVLTFLKIPSINFFIAVSEGFKN